MITTLNLWFLKLKRAEGGINMHESVQDVQFWDWLAVLVMLGLRKRILQKTQ